MMMIRPTTSHKRRAAESRAKAAFDRIVCLVLLVALAPLMTLLSLAILCTIGRPILFRQLRTGLNGRRFSILKFRTMRDPDPSWTDPSDDMRVTRLGKLLRLTSLDELPQILNVLKGDMSLVGPRPQLVEFEKFYTPHQFRRHEVKPGITGWAQVNGRNSIPWEERFNLDVWYVDNWSFLLDMKIIAITPIRLCSMRQAAGPYRFSEKSFGPDQQQNESGRSATVTSLKVIDRKIGV
jgi:sugar transferase EpsL